VGPFCASFPQVASSPPGPLLGMKGLPLPKCV
jgi:hypothetical protein